VRDHRPGPHNLGQTQMVEVGPDLWVANCFSQNYYGRDGRRYADPFAIYKAFTALLKWLKGRPEAIPLPLYMTRIGCNNGGLDWDQDVLPVLQMACHTQDYRATITVCDWEGVK
jgi:hypothetical protein